MAWKAGNRSMAIEQLSREADDRNARQRLSSQFRLGRTELAGADPRRSSDSGCGGGQRAPVDTEHERR